MTKLCSLIVRPALSVLLLPAMLTVAGAQRLPNVQKESLRPPNNIKIDGKATEWNDKFRAFNNATEVFYTLANDDNNLYLTVQATKPRIIEKIMAVGITFMVNNAGRTSDKANENRSVTFPVIDVQYGQKIISAMRIKTLNIGRGQAPRTDQTYTPGQVDSLTEVANKLLSVNAKTIKLKGINELTDTLLSVYNEERIRVAETFDSKGTYNYELAVPFKYMGLAKDNLPKFSYSIKLRSRLDDGKKGTTMVYRYNDAGAYDANQDLDSTTDFWGEYTLAKK